MRLGEMRRHPLYTLTVGQKMVGPYRKSDERLNKACQRSKKRQLSRC